MLRLVAIHGFETLREKDNKFFIDTIQKICDDTKSDTEVGNEEIPSWAASDDLVSLFTNKEDNYLMQWVGDQVKWLGERNLLPYVEVCYTLDIRCKCQF
jgi:hypothetical protein